MSNAHELSVFEAMIQVISYLGREHFQTAISLGSTRRSFTKLLDLYTKTNFTTVTFPTDVSKMNLDEVHGRALCGPIQYIIKFGHIVYEADLGDLTNQKLHSGNKIKHRLYIYNGVVFTCMLEVSYKRVADSGVFRIGKSIHVYVTNDGLHHFGCEKPMVALKVAIANEGLHKIVRSGIGARYPNVANVVVNNYDKFPQSFEIRRIPN